MTICHEPRIMLSHICVYLESYQNENLRCLGDISVCKVLFTQAQRPEFGSPSTNVKARQGSIQLQSQHRQTKHRRNTDLDDWSVS